ncbi:Peptide transporter PTR3-B [Platanthera guangdongensis]|uniref:Peptide transporter PTR3-B n=1 Tax=Platanthera guangdongensis TaxID=2320717 RepID=A0ABR2MGG1_9ASPA
MAGDEDVESGGLRSEEELYTKDGTVDIQGRPFLRSKGGRWSSFSFIIGAEMFERVTYYGVAANLEVYMTQELHQGTTSSATNVSNWIGTMMITPIISAYFADAYIGQYWMTIYNYAIYLLGMVLLTLTVSIPLLWPQTTTKWFQIASFYCSIYIVAIGIGGTKVNIGTLGANQFDNSVPRERAERTSFFNWWTFAISAGNLFSTIVIVYVQANVSWVIGYTILTLAIAISMFIFRLGTPFYRHRLPSGSPFTKIARVLVASAKKWKVAVPADPGELHELDAENYSTEGKRRINHTTSLRFLDKSAVKSGPTSPWMLCSITEVEQTKKLIKMLPVFIFTIMPSVMVAQVLTLFIKQGMTLDCSIGPRFNMPPASLSAFFILGTLITIVIYDRWFVPFARKHTSNPRGLGLLQRIGIGLVMHIIIMFLAAMVERWRLSTASERRVTVFVLLPQFALMGVAEVFVAVGKLEFFYDQAPEGMKSLGTSFFSSSLGIGSFVSSLLLWSIAKITGRRGGEEWIRDDLNESHLDYYYAFLAVLCVINFLLFVIVSNCNYYNSDGVGSENQQAQNATEMEPELAAPAT